MKDQKFTTSTRANMSKAALLREARKREQRALAEQANRDRLPPAEGART